MKDNPIDMAIDFLETVEYSGYDAGVDKENLAEALTALRKTEEVDVPALKMDRVWAMPNKWTFTILPIKKLLLELTDDYSNWVDPFAGMNSPCGITNDLREDMPTTYHMCALEFLKSLPDNSFDGVLYDPPYSITQAKECYEGAGMKNLAGSMRWWADVKDEIARITKPSGTVVCFGWSSNGVGKGRGFKMDRVLLVPHGGSKNDTIVTVETKAALADEGE